MHYAQLDLLEKHIESITNKVIKISETITTEALTYTINHHLHYKIRGEIKKWNLFIKNLFLPV